MIELIGTIKRYIKADIKIVLNVKINKNPKNNTILNNKNIVVLFLVLQFFLMSMLEFY